MLELAIAQPCHNPHAIFISSLFRIEEDCLEPIGTIQVLFRIQVDLLTCAIHCVWNLSVIYESTYVFN